MNTRDKILTIAQNLVIQKGAKSVTVTEVAELIGITHQAAYKHFKNKKQLMEQLALLWLDEILEPVITFDGKNIHDWMWTLASAKKRAYEENPEMFALYTHYISSNLTLENEHNEHLANLLCNFTKNDDKIQDYRALIQAFMTFQHPVFAESWNEEFQENFENVWNLVSSQFS